MNLLTRTILFFVVALSQAFGDQAAANSIVDALQKAQELALKRQVAEAMIRLEQERVKNTQQVSTPQQSTTATSARLEREMRAAVPVIAARYPDFEIYIPEITRLAALFVPSDSPQATGELYLEGLYALAKNARFSTAALKPNTAGKALENSDIVSLVQAGIGDETIVAKIQSSSQNFRLDPKDLVELKAAHISDSVLKAMIQSQRQIVPR